MITLTMKDDRRLDIIQRVYRSELTVVQAALVMGVSERQCYRVKARVGKAGAKGVVHATVDGRVNGRSRGRLSRIVELAQGNYKDLKNIIF
jgi:predicted DNA-binding transcriptional regulator YafY